MEHLQFTNAIARLRVLETRLLDKSKIERMIDSQSPYEALKILEETEYGNIMTNVKSPSDYEQILKDELKRVYDLIYEISPEKSLVNIMALKYDYHNIKVMIKGEKLNKDLSYLLIPAGTVDINLLKEIFSNGTFKNLSTFMQEAIEKVKKSFEDLKDPQQIDIILDNYMYKEMLSIADEIGEDFIKDYIKISIDFNNLRTLLRVKAQDKSRSFLKEVLIHGGFIDEDIFLNLKNDSLDNIANKLSSIDYEKVIRPGIEEYEKVKNISYLEKLCEDYIINFIKKSKYISFGVEPIIAYILAKENEIKIIRIIMVGKLNNISPQIIRERLRDTYV